MESMLTLAMEQPVKKNTLKKYKIACVGLSPLGSYLTTTSVSQAQVILLPQPPE
ncbi:ENPP3 isoform 4 [Pan troglodytes]|uniref:ENPP3 isoform 4 n=1 Tax=Pan troglodytes TaxID=9598 RepID=A0A2J8PT69_PANTR|nr:ENPP3 isoform 4 [Pan troglodytes]